jgi:molybdopterin-guanine dinucleotide biosynthesis protein A
VSTNSTTRAKIGGPRHTSATALASPEFVLARRPSRTTVTVMAEMTWSGLLLAAGASRRMGRDKATLPAADGHPLWRRQLDVLAQAGASVLLVSARPEQTWPPPDTVRIEDRVANAGPLAGIAAALARCPTTHLLVLAIDLPALPAQWFEELRQSCAPGCGAAGVHPAGTVAGRYEPLAAVYPRELTGWAEEALARRELALQPLLRRAATAGLLRPVPIAAARAAWFENWNEPHPDGVPPVVPT